MARRRLLRLTPGRGGLTGSTQVIGAMVVTQQAQPVTAARRQSGVMTCSGVRVVAVMPARVDVDVDVIEVPDRVHQVMAHGLGHDMALAHGQILIDHDCDRGRQPVPHPAGRDLQPCPHATQTADDARAACTRTVR